jgi:hypothetical protein
MKSNKGQMEVQFSWIFVAIVGAIILAFFVSIAVTQKKSAERESGITFLTEFDKALTGISVVEGNTLLFEDIPANLKYDCTSGCDCGAYVAASRAQAKEVFSMADKVLFSPDSFRGEALVAWSKEWIFPFRVTNFIFLTSPQVKYLIEDTARGKEIFEQLPPQFIEKDQQRKKALDKQLFDPEQGIQDITGNYKAKFVFFEKDPSAYVIPTALVNLPNADVAAIKVDGSSISFYQKDKQGTGAKFALKETSSLFGEATLYGALFAEDFDEFACMMDRAFTALSVVSRTYEEKIYNYSQQDVLKERGCSPYYGGELIASIRSYSENADFKEGIANVQEILSAAQTFSVQNENILREGCPQIY